MPVAVRRSRSSAAACPRCRSLWSCLRPRIRAHTAVWKGLGRSRNGPSGDDVDIDGRTQRAVRHRPGRSIHPIKPPSLWRNRPGDDGMENPLDPVLARASPRRKAARPASGSSGCTAHMECQALPRPPHSWSDGLCTKTTDGCSLKAIVRPPIVPPHWRGRRWSKPSHCGSGAHGGLGVAPELGLEIGYGGPTPTVRNGRVPPVVAMRSLTAMPPWARPVRLVSCVTQSTWAALAALSLGPPPSEQLDIAEREPKRFRGVDECSIARAATGW